MPDIPELTDKKLNVICLSEHTNSDMSKWSFEMNQEREELTINVSSSLLVFVYLFTILFSS